jgi:hypothetical protein
MYWERNHNTGLELKTGKMEVFHTRELLMTP